MIYINTFLASSDFCCLLITFANSLDPDQYGHTVGSDLDQKPFVTLCSSKNVFEKVNFEKVSS